MNDSKVCEIDTDDMVILIKILVWLGDHCPEHVMSQLEKEFGKEMDRIIAKKDEIVRRVK